MSGTGQLKSINCTHCGAGLPVLGGGRVTTQVCGYCGASLDATDNFRVLEVFAEMSRPDTPFRLGMTGEIGGVPFTVTGIKGMSEPGYGAWVDHMLFSPTHGYIWLTLEDGHLILTRKQRQGPGTWLTVQQVERADHKPSRKFRGKRYVYYETTNWEIDFVEGAFNFRPARGDRGTTVSLANWSDARPRMLSLIQPGSKSAEREVELSEYAPEAAAAFGVELPRPRGIHPLQPYSGAAGRFYKLWYGAMVAASIALLVVVISAHGSPQRVISARLDGLPAQGMLEVTDSTRPVALDVVTDIDNSWAEFPVRVTSPGGAPVVDAVVPIAYYWGIADGERWTEGTREQRVTFLPPETGTYRVELAAPEGEAVAQRRISQAQVFGYERVLTIRWPVLAILLFLGLFVFSLTHKWRYRRRQAAGSDWTEED